jgi:hypothetical protein
MRMAACIGWNLFTPLSLKIIKSHHEDCDHPMRSYHEYPVFGVETKKTAKSGSQELMKENNPLTTKILKSI